MGLLDGLLGNVLGSVLGGGQQAQDPKMALLQGVLGMLANRGQGGGTGGGLEGLLGAFGQNGLGDVLGSWIGTGQNANISPDQIMQVLGSLQGGSGGQTEGENLLAQLAQQSGLSQGDAAQHLTDLLPQVIDQLTPNGQVPEGGFGDLQGLLGQFMKK